jgi:hypothetical protein
MINMMFKQENFEDPYFSKTIDVKLESEYDTQTYIADFAPSRQGHYAICIDNRNSRFTQKNIQIDLSPKNPPEYKVNPAEFKSKTLTEPEIDVTKMANAMKGLLKIEHGIHHIQMQQMRDKHRLILHTDANEANYSDVFISSIIETLIFMAVSLFQVNNHSRCINYSIFVHYTFPTLRLLLSRVFLICFYFISTCLP